MTPLSAHMQAAVAIAQADVAEFGYAAPRARFVFAGPVAPLEVHPAELQAAALEGLTGPARDDAAGDHYVAQLDGGRGRIADKMLRQGLKTLPAGAWVVLTFMEALPPRPGTGDEVGFGAFVEVWQHGPRLLVRGVMRLLITEGETPRLQPLELLEINPDTEPPLAAMN